MGTRQPSTARVRRKRVFAFGLGLAALGLIGGAFALHTTPAASAARIETGKELFTHEWTPGDPLAGEGDGLGPVFNEKSCVACHFQGGVGGAGTNEKNVATFEALPTKRDRDMKGGVIHTFAIEDSLKESQENLERIFPIIPGSRREVAPGCVIEVPDFNPVRVAATNTPALFGVGLIKKISAGSIRGSSFARGIKNIGKEFNQDFSSVPMGRVRVLDDGRVGKFGWKGQFATLEDFVAAACAVEIGLTNPLRQQDRARRHVRDEQAKLDIDQEQFLALVSFVESLPRPEQILPSDPAARKEVEHGEKLFGAVGCAECHTPSVGGVDGIYSDFMLYQVVDETKESTYGDVDPTVPVAESHPRPGEWKTPPLWGVADSAPYFHDGGSATLESAIKRHAAAAKGSRERFEKLKVDEQQALIAFLKTLRAPQTALPAPVPANAVATAQR